MRYKTEFEDAVRDALAALPDRDRLLLRLTTVSGLSHEQIAEHLQGQPVDRLALDRARARRGARRRRAQRLRKLRVQRDELCRSAGAAASAASTVSISRVPRDVVLLPRLDAQTALSMYATPDRGAGDSRS
jgi:hypothetical protein